jgi:hypothetical protein
VSAAKTWVPELPASWCSAWREAYLRRHSSGLLGPGGGSILAAPHDAESTEHERKLRFGPVWAWWGLTEAQRAAWWELG